MGLFFSGSDKHTEDLNLRFFPFELQVRYGDKSRSSKMCLPPGEWVSVARFKTLPDMKYSVQNSVFHNFSFENIRFMYKEKIIELR